MAILLIVFSFYLVFSHNSYQRSIYLTSANKITGWFYETSNKVNAFLYLQKNNKELLDRNAKLENELYALKSIITENSEDSLALQAFGSDSLYVSQFTFIPAEVVNVSFSGVNNFLTLNRGIVHGVKPDMGVISQKGVVGVVLNASKNYSVVIPVINPKFRLSAKLKGSDNTGSVSWDGNHIREAQLNELPKHQLFEEGDTVLTSFSRIFPKEIVIGYVSGLGKSKDDKFNTLDMQLATDFYSIQDVFIIDDKFYEEQRLLEESVDTE